MYLPTFVELIESYLFSQKSGTLEGHVAVLGLNGAYPSLLVTGYLHKRVGSFYFDSCNTPLFL